MKAIIITILSTLFLVISNTELTAQEKTTSIDTTSFQVRGVCNMCKDRIENAALTKGVKWVEWDKKTEQLTVIYKKGKADLEKVHQSIADAGHTTEKIECNKDAYSKLPNCCLYDSGAKKH